MLPIKVFGVEGKEEDKAEDILCKARTGAGHVTDIMGCNKGSRAARVGVGTHGCKVECGARVRLGDVACIHGSEGPGVTVQVTSGTEANVGGRFAAMIP